MILALVLAAPVAGQATGRVSVDSSGIQGNAGSFEPSISGDGRYVAFMSDASNLVAGDTNSAYDVFVRDRRTGATERVSVDSSGAESDGGIYACSISADGRYVAFDSGASDLVPGDTNQAADVFVHDRQTGTTTRVSVDSNGTQGNAHSYLGRTPSLSADGRIVVFESSASNLVTGDTNSAHDVFVRDRQSGVTARVSVGSAGAQANDGSTAESISPDGRYVGFTSDASDLVAGDTNTDRDAFVHDRRTGVTERVSVDSGGAQADDECDFASVSADGRYVAFGSWASNLGGGDATGFGDIFVRDRQNGTTEYVSVDSGGGAHGNGYSRSPRISADGRFVAFFSEANNLVGGDWNNVPDIFVRDRQRGVTERASVDSLGAQANNGSYGPAYSGDGRYVAFYTTASNLVGGDTNGFYDVYVRDRDYVPFESLCHPGADGVIDCPCANPPAAPGRGCNNSDGTTYGATLWATGIAYLSADTLVFTTGGEVSTATSLVLQGNAFLPSGVVYGEGVRCVGGALRRLYTKSASAGSISAPDFAAGDPSISVRSSARGVPIQPGQSRWYLVYYRDPAGMGCQPPSGFNATLTVEVQWFP